MMNLVGIIYALLTSESKMVTKDNKEMSVNIIVN